RSRPCCPSPSPPSCGSQSDQSPGHPWDGSASPAETDVPCSIPSFRITLLLSLIVPRRTGGSLRTMWLNLFNLFGGGRQACSFADRKRGVKVSGERLPIPAAAPAPGSPPGRVSSPAGSDLEPADC